MSWKCCIIHPEQKTLRCYRTSAKHNEVKATLYWNLVGNEGNASQHTTSRSQSNRHFNESARCGAHSLSAPSLIIYSILGNG